jgi:hypothetical protein
MKTIKIKTEAIDPTGVIYNFVDVNLNVYDNYSRMVLTIGEHKWMVTEDGKVIDKLPS